jgi:hypothetical protein
MSNDNGRNSLCEKRTIASLKKEAKLTTLKSYSLFLKERRKFFSFTKETKTSNDTCNLLLFSVKKKQKIVTL